MFEPGGLGKSRSVGRGDAPRFAGCFERHIPGYPGGNHGEAIAVVEL